MAGTHGPICSIFVSVSKVSTVRLTYYFSLEGLRQCRWLHKHLLLHGFHQIRVKDLIRYSVTCLSSESLLSSQTHQTSILSPNFRLSNPSSLTHRPTSSSSGVTAGVFPSLFSQAVNPSRRINTQRGSSRHRPYASPSSGQFLSTTVPITPREYLLAFVPYAVSQ